MSSLVFGASTQKIYLVQFVEEWEDFRLPEFKALLALAGLDPVDVLTQGQYCDYDEFQLQSKKRDQIQHFMYVTFPNEEVIKFMCNRSILIKAVYELWGKGSNFKELLASTAESTVPTPYMDASLSWSMKVDAFNKSLTEPQKALFREQFGFLDFKGPVKLAAPDNDVWIVLDFTRNQTGHPYPVGNTAEEIVQLDMPCYIGRLVARGGMKEALKKYDLKKRLYLGPTSLDDSLAFIMANLSGVKCGHVAYDPFVGTASILIANAHLGAQCFGSDIDPRVLKGEMYAGKADRKTDTTKRDIFENFRSYGLVAPELIRMDNHNFDRHMTFGDKEEQDCGFFDAIVTDPPYGIRAGARKSGKATPVTYALTEEQRKNHVPVTQTYAVEEVMLDLLHTAARSLRIGGRLSYLIPTTYDFVIEDLPVHPCLRMEAVCHQPLSVRHGRRAVVMVKTQAYTKALQSEFATYKQYVISHDEAGFGALKGKLEKALASDAFENEEVVKQISNRCKVRKEKTLAKVKARKEGILPENKWPPKGSHKQAGGNDGAASATDAAADGGGDVSEMEAFANNQKKPRTSNSIVQSSSTEFNDSRNNDSISNSNIVAAAASPDADESSGCGKMVPDEV